MDDDGDVLPEPAQEVVPGLFVGEIAALSADFLASNKINVVLSCGIALLSTPLPVTVWMHGWFVLDDMPSAKIEPFLPSCVVFIQTALHRGLRVLVHCHAGVSRSCSVVTAYLIATQGLSAMRALRMLRSKRAEAMPNGGFMAQLRNFELRARISSALLVETDLPYSVSELTLAFLFGSPAPLACADTS